MAISKPSLSEKANKKLRFFGFPGLFLHPRATTPYLSDTLAALVATDTGAGNIRYKAPY